VFRRVTLIIIICKYEKDNTHVGGRVWGCGSPGGAWPCVPVPPCSVVWALAFSPLTRLDYSDVDDTFAFWLPLARS